MSGVSAYLDFRDLCPMFAQAAGRDAIGVPPAIRCYIGKDDYDVDFRVYGETSGAYLQYDGANDKMYLYNSSNTSTNPGRMLLISGTVTGAMASGNQLQGMQISATFNGSASCSGGICGAEIKARHTAGNAFTCTQLRGVVGNADTKSGTTTTAYGLEASIDVSVGGTITTGALIHANLNNSGTVTNSYVLLGEGTAGVNVDYGIYLRYVKRPFYASATLTGASALNAVEIGVTDSSTFSSTSYSRGLYVNFSNAGAKTGGGEVDVVGIDFDATANVPIAACISLYTGSCTGATINHLAGIYMYLDQVAGTVTMLHGMWIQMDSDGPTTSYFISLQNMAATTIPHAIINSQSVGHCATYLLHLSGTTYPPPTGEQRPFHQGELVTNAGADVDCDGYLLISVSNTDLYIPVYDTKK